MKKRTVVLMAMLLCAVSLAACGKDKETDSSPQGEVSVSDTTNDTTEAEKERAPPTLYRRGVAGGEAVKFIQAGTMPGNCPVAGVEHGRQVLPPPCRDRRRSNARRSGTDTRYVPRSAHPEVCRDRDDVPARRRSF